MSNRDLEPWEAGEQRTWSVSTTSNAEPLLVSVTPREGETCGTCQRRVPHKRKPTTPKTKRVGYQVPVDDVDSHTAVLDAAAFHLGVEGQPYARFKTLALAAALVLQDESLKDFGRREQP